MRGGFVGRRGTVQRRRDPNPMQLQPVAAARRGRLRREPDLVQRRVEHVTCAVTGEHPAGSIGTVRGRCQTDDGQRGVRRPETRRGPSPVFPAIEGAALDLGDLLPPGHQARAGPAVDHRLVQFGQAARACSQVGREIGIVGPHGRPHEPGRGCRCGMPIAFPRTRVDAVLRRSYWRRNGGWGGIRRCAGAGRPYNPDRSREFWIIQQLRCVAVRHRPARRPRHRRLAPGVS